VEEYPESVLPEVWIPFIRELSIYPIPAWFFPVLTLTTRDTPASRFFPPDKAKLPLIQISELLCQKEKYDPYGYETSMCMGMFTGAVCYILSNLKATMESADGASYRLKQIHSGADTYYKLVRSGDSKESGGGNNQSSSSVAPSEAPTNTEMEVVGDIDERLINFYSGPPYTRDYSEQLQRLNKHFHLQLDGITARRTERLLEQSLSEIVGGLVDASTPDCGDFVWVSISGLRRTQLTRPPELALPRMQHVSSTCGPSVMSTSNGVWSAPVDVDSRRIANHEITEKVGGT
jgi:hypothetical protein